MDENKEMKDDKKEYESYFEDGIDKGTDIEEIAKLIAPVGGYDCEVNKVKEGFSTVCGPRPYRAMIFIVPARRAHLIYYLLSFIYKKGFRRGGSLKNLLSSCGS